MEKLDPKSIENVLALTPLQEGMLFHYLKDSGSNLYCEQLSLGMSGEIDIQVFKKAWNVVIHANEMLRTVFRWDKLEKPSQLILKEHKCDVVFYDLSNEKTRKIDSPKTFDLHQVPFRITLCKLAETQYEIIITNHHILYDGWSNGIILKEFFKVYRSLSLGQSIKLPMKPSFKEFIKWSQSLDKNKQKQFWQEYLAGFDETTELPIKKKNVNTPGTGQYSINLEREFSNKMNAFVKSNHVTLASIFYTAWGLLLHKYTGNENVIFGTTVSGRSAPVKGIEEMVGLFINTIPLRIDTYADGRIFNVVSQVDRLLYEREEFEHTPLVDIQGYSTQGSRVPLFNTILVIENYPLDNHLIPQGSPLSVHSYAMMETTHYDLTVGIMPFNKIEIKFSFKRELVEKEVIQKLAGHFKRILQIIIEYPETVLSQLEIITIDEKKRILTEFNNTAVEYPRDKSIHQLFEDQVLKSPDHVAIFGHGHASTTRTNTDNNVGANRHLLVCPISLTYHELNNQSNSLAGLLIEKGVLPDTIVGIMMKRSIEMLSGIMGILKAGGAYMPIDQEYPQERIDYMLKDSRAAILLTDYEKEKMNNRQLSIVNCQQISQPQVPFHYSNHLAYIIYTSGSTGKPKGALIDHRSVVRLVKNTNYIKFEQEDRILQTGALTFDASTFEIWGALLNGLTLYLINNEIILDAKKLKKKIQEYQITIMWMTAPLFNQTLEVDSDIFTSLRSLLVGGDKLSPAHINRLKNKCPHINIINGYGPTENTTFSTTFLIDGQYLESIPIGKPIANSTAYIMDSFGKLQPIGIAGDLWVGGDGVARGYLNNPELTCKKFKIINYKLKIINGSSTLRADSNAFGDEENFQHSAFELPLTPHSNFYSTGDLARWLSDGNIEFLGRIDNQVKIRGFRIELGEIENQLLKHKYIKEAVVILNNDAITDKNLTAYIVSIEAFHENELREYLQKNLPDYMIPSYFVQLEKIPLTPNGKVDRTVLPEPRMKAGKSYIAPGNEIEKKLVEIWSEVLGRDELHIIQLNETIGINDNFFQLGGHSLKATILSAKIHKAFNANIPLSKIFTIPTIRGLANYIKSALQEKYLTIEPIEKKEYYSLSSAQKRLYILYQMNPQGIGYNISSFLVLEGAIDKEKLEHTFKLMIRRHESLRTSFHMINDEPVQRIHDKVEFEIEYLATEAFIRPFDLSNAPLLRVGLIKENENKHILMMDMHHIISDGTSINIMVKDFMALYQGEFPSELQIQYKDFSNWQNDEKQAESLKRQGEFWLNEFAGEIPVLELPVDYPRPAVQSFEGSSIPFEIDKETVGVLKTLALELGATIYMILLSLYTVFLAKLTNQEDIVIGSPIAGRRHVDLEKIIGMFVNTLALRNYPLGEKLFIYFLEEVKEKTLAAFNNQEYPYEDMVEQVATSVNRDTARNPLFDTMFALQNIKGGVIEIPGLKIEPYVFENKTAKFDLTLTAVEIEDELELTFAYSTQLFKRETIQRFINYFINAAVGVTGVMKDKTLRIGDISIISTQEKNRILYDFNNTAREYSVHKTLSQWFDEQVERTPESIAVVGPGFSAYPVYLAYKELSGLARRLAYVLQAKGMNSAVNPIVPIMMERTVEMIVGIWGILKAGGAFLPIDPHSPEDRIKYMLEDSGTKLLAVANSQEGKKVRRWKGEKVLLESIIDSLNHLPYHHSTFDIPRIQHSNHLCYIIYTSGSTGRPKGVMIEHGNLVNLVEGLKQSIYSRYHQELNVSLVSPFVFDASIKQIFGALLLGHALHIIPEAIRFNGKSLLDYLIKYKIDVSDGTPSHLRLLIENITAESLPVDIKLFIIGGEALSRDIAGSFFNKFSCQAPGIINIYGPTECTVDTTYFELNNENHQHLKTNIAIGKPLANYSVYIVDLFKRLQPVGTAGELLVGGKGVGRGYLNNPELTNDRFILPSGTGATGNPFEKGFLDFPKLLPNYQSPFTTHHSPHTLYKTGDLARWLNDGNIEFLGRIDQQVKIRGFRIELGEIENRLLGIPGIKESVVSIHEEVNDKYICAYFVAGRKYEEMELREMLLKQLPGYMLPSYFIRLETIPLTPNGKIDVKVLPKPALKSGHGYAAPRNEIERKLAVIWNEVLGYAHDAIGIDDHFFQLGGHSLKAMLLVSRIEKAFHVKMPLVEIFKQPHIRGLAGYIKDARQSQYEQIEWTEKKEYYVLSSAQKRLYFLQQMDRGGTAYNISAAWILEGVLDQSNLEDVLIQLLKRHESLRTSFITICEEPVQRVHDEVEFEIEKLDGRGDPLWSPFVRPFDLSKAPLLRAGLVKLAEEKHLFLVDMHHIISDGMSSQVLMRDFSMLYTGNELPGIKLQYKDYAEWENRNRAGNYILAQGEYWRKEYAGEIPVLALPTDYIRPSIQDFEGKSLNFEISKEITGFLKTLTSEAGATLYIVLLALYTIFLAKLCSQEDIVVGSPAAGRRHTDLECIMGMFVNTLALRNYPSGEKLFTYFLEEVKEKTLAAFENQDYQYENLVEEVAVTRDAGRNPLFDAMFVLQNMSTQEIIIPGLKLSPYEYENKTAKFDLTLTVVEEEDKLKFIFEYSVKLFKEATIKQFIAYFINIINGVIADKSRKISELVIITETEKNEILSAFNNTEKEYPTGKSIEQLFAEQVEKAPDRVAVFGPCLSVWKRARGQITYCKLNEQSNRLAGHLIEKGVLVDSVVGMMIERSVEMIIGIWGILKAGGAYLPIDPEYPRERIDYMLKDSKATLTINYEFLKEAPQAPLHLQHSAFIAQHSNLIYVIYTSGSTGKPKGAMIEKRGFLNLLYWYMEELRIGKEDNHLLIAPVSFDLAQKNLFSPLLSGGRLTLALPGIPDYIELKKLISINHISVINCAPSVFYPLVELKLNEDDDFSSLHSLRAVVLGGEPIRVDRLLPWIHSTAFDCEIFNTYGPTECTDIATCYRLEAKTIGKDEIIPIGKPIANVKVYILDKYRQVLPVKIPGELCIGGIGVSEGYYHNKELTEEKFIATPHLPVKRIYCTGDLTRRLSDGNIEFLGRIDQQVKVRGLRIELGEIESQLVKHEAVKEAVVVARKNESGENYLCAYLVAGGEGPLETSILRDYLRELLPGYMVPSYFIFLEAMPLTPSGKIDRRSLPGPQVAVEKNYTAPRNRVEAHLVEIWSEILDKKACAAGIGIDDHFFQLGGHSLKAARMAAKIHKEFKVKIPLIEIFKSPTIRGLSGYINEALGEKYISIEPVEKREYYALSSAQKRMYFLQQMDIDETVYNIPAAWILEGIIDKTLLQQHLVKLIQRHESLRTSFIIINDEPMQRIHNEVEFEIEYKEHGQTQTLTGVFGPTFFQKGGFIRPFDLSKAPLLRVGLVKEKEDRHILMVDMHHIISDGTSINILVKDFVALYQDKYLPELRVQYKDFSGWQKDEKQSELLKQQGEYWLNELAGEIPVLELPLDYPRPAVQSFSGSRIPFEIDKESTVVLRALALKTGVTLYMLLLALYTVFLSKITGQEEIGTGSAIAGRIHTDLTEIIGMFVNTLVIRNYPSAEKTFSLFLDEVKVKALKAFENQDYQYEDLVEQVVINRDISRNPLFDAMFVLQNIEIAEISIPGLKLSPYPYENKTAKFDLTLTAVEEEEKLVFNFEYSTKLFKEETVNRFITYFKNIVNDIIKNKDRRISDFEIITEEEKNQIIYDFNDTEAEYPADKTIHQLFAEQAERIPDHIALVGADLRVCPARNVCPVSLTYRQLNNQSNSLANSLIEKGALPDTIIGIMMERSVEMIIGILGILKSGGAYMPIDPGYPEERIDYMLKDSAALILLTDDEKKTDNCQLSIVNTQLSMSERPRCGLTGYPHRGLHHSNQLAYIIYTSGSTGKPKGVMVEHRNVVNLAISQKKRFAINETDRVLQFSSLCFDASVEQIFIAFFSGAVLLLIDKNTLLDNIKFEELISSRLITHLHAVPSFLNNISLKEGYQLKRVISGGDICPPGLARKYGAYCDFYNEYGPTETTVTSIEMQYTDVNEVLDHLPIGKAIANTFVYLFDKWLKPVPLGVAAELYIGGAGVSRGYLNRPELTCKKFKIINYKLKIINGSGTLRDDLNAFGDEENFQHSAFILNGRPRRGLQHSILFRTGDLARWLPDGPPAGGAIKGIIEFLGRIDHQIKIRGFRIELGEIENCLMHHPKIKEAIASVQEEESGDKYLCAYIVSDDEFVISELREYLANKLPEYMVPSYFIKLAKIPLTPSGKLDRKALPKPELKAGCDYVAPRNEIEKKLVKLWSEILGKDEPHPLPLQNTIGIDANFFHMGGHSLKAMVLALRIQKEFKVRVQLSEIFKTPTIRQLSDLVAGRKEKESFGIEVIEKKEFYELSYNQKRLWVIRALELSSSSFNMPGRIELKHPVVEEMLRNTISKLVQRHESLRTGFKPVNDEPVQYIKKDVEIPFETVDISSLNAEKKQIVREQLYAEEKKFLFDLNQAPLIRFRLIKISSDHYDLIFNMHHIISDGWSIEILQKEFSHYYEACRNGKEYKPESLTFQYKDYAARQNKHLLDPCKQEQSRQYWQEKLMGDVESFTLFKLPVNPGGNPDDYTGAGYCCLLDGETKEKLEQLARHTGSTLFMVMFSAYLLLLSRLANREDVTCSIISAGRDEPGVQDIVGFFVNSILFSIKVDLHEPFRDFIRRVNTEILEVFRHQYYSIETIFKELKMKYPDVPASFNMLNTIEEPAAEGIENFKPGHTENVQDVKFDLEVYAAQYKNGILLNWVYKKSLFDPATIEYIGNLYMESLDFFKDHAHENFVTYKNKENKNKGKKVGFKRN